MSEITNAFNSEYPNLKSLLNSGQNTKELEGSFEDF